MAIQCVDRKPENNRSTPLHKPRSNNPSIETSAYSGTSSGLEPPPGILGYKRCQRPASERNIEYSSPRSWIRLDEFLSNIRIFESEPQLPNLVIDTVFMGIIYIKTPDKIMRPTSKLSTQLQLKLLFVTSFSFNQYWPQKVRVQAGTRENIGLSIPLFRIFSQFVEIE